MNDYDREAIEAKEDYDAEQYDVEKDKAMLEACLLYTSPSPRDGLLSRMPSSA